jgi:50S ribosomal protein L16 3-hydroxylase
MSVDRQGSLPLELLGGLSAEQFLRDYWQKRPLLIRQAIPDYQCPIDGNDLAGLALEEDVESRLIIEKQNWALKRGPFKAKDFKSLPKTHWTLLVQQLDAWSPDINALKALFDFIPNWRIDDVMASYAPDGGSVGPHFDDYDVFLLQAQGQRHWQIGQWCDESTPRLPHPHLKLLADFASTESWVLEPGDMLYLPPKLAHYGIAQNDCITLSIGFRAPSIPELIDRFVSHALDTCAAVERYQDPDLTVQTEPGEISASTLSRVHDLIQQALKDRSKMAAWFGELVTEPKNTGVIQPLDEPIDHTTLQQIITENWTLHQNEGSRFAYACESGDLTLFHDSHPIKLDQQTNSSYPSSLEFAQKICRIGSLSARELVGNPPNPTLVDAVRQLLNTGSLYCEELDD